MFHPLEPKFNNQKQKITQMSSISNALYKQKYDVNQQNRGTSQENENERADIVFDTEREVPKWKQQMFADNNYNELEI